MPQATSSLRRRGHPLSLAEQQLQVLLPSSGHPRFAERLESVGVREMQADRIEILQINLGKRCNMTCAHCHVDAGPDRREMMNLATVEACLGVVRNQPEIRTLDLTGGAPEMNPHFRDLVQTARGLGRRVIDRCNLTILVAQGFTDLPRFLADHQVELVASLPCYLEENTDAQRGNGAFSESIQALRELNALGYGHEGSGRLLTLVYNPVGPSLPPAQLQLEASYRQALDSRYGIRFNRLFTITNMPISRYLDYLVSSGQLDDYMQTLIDAFNPAAVDGLMCRNTLSVSWDGRLFDCDFNQMLDLSVTTDVRHIEHFDHRQLAHRKIVVGQHCFGCTAGAGSGCQGAIAE